MEFLLQCNRFKYKKLLSEMLLRNVLQKLAFGYFLENSNENISAYVGRKTTFVEIVVL